MSAMRMLVAVMAILPGALACGARSGHTSSGAPSSTVIEMGAVTKRYCVRGVESDSLRFDVTLLVRNTGSRPVYLPADAWWEVSTVYAAVDEAHAAKRQWAYEMNLLVLSAAEAPYVFSIAPGASRQQVIKTWLMVDKRGTFLKPGAYLLYFVLDSWVSANPRAARESRKLAVSDQVHATSTLVGPIPFELVADYQAQSCS